MKKVKQGIKTYVRTNMLVVARALDIVSKGKVTPNIVTIVGTLMHFPIAVLIATNHFWWALVLLIVFGLFDTLDGALARVQDLIYQQF